MDLRSTLGRCLQHALLRSEEGRPWPHLEKWELDWAVADPVGYQYRHVPTWVRDELNMTEPLPDLDPRRGRVSDIAAQARAEHVGEALSVPRRKMGGVPGPTPAPNA